MKKIAKDLVFQVMLLASILSSLPAYAQVAGATLSGTVTDQSGAIVPNTQVTARNIATGVSNEVTGNSVGLFTIPNLLPGSYEIAVSAPGFKTLVRSGITLTVGVQQVLNVTLQVGEVSGKIEVTGEAPTVELQSSTIGAVVEQDTVVGLPLNKRDWTQLATLQAGVNSIPTQPTTNGGLTARGNRGFGNQLSISGTRPQANNYRLDGISIMDFAGGAPGNVTGAALGVDAVAEFSVLTSNYSAEYGRTSGGVINAITKSGSNQLHGSAYWFLRDEGLDARNFFDTTIPPFHRNQFGGSVGGPIQKDKTFFFFDYEGIRQDFGMTNIDIVPSQDARNGIIHNADGTTTIIGAPGSPLQNSEGTVGVDPKVQPYLAFWPLPKDGLIGPGNTGYYDVAINAVTTENFETARVDHTFSQKDKIFGSWFTDRGLISQPDSLKNWSLGNQSDRDFGSLEETHSFSGTLVNSLRVGYSRVDNLVNNPVQVLNPIASDTSLGTFPNRPAPGIQVPGITTNVGGFGAQGIISAKWNSYQIYDDAFLSKGAHSLKFGFAAERMQTDPQILNHQNGAFVFGGLTSFLTNQPVAFSGQAPGQLYEFGIRQSLFGGYIQDDWRLRPNLTINLGLRYEMATVPTEVNNKLSNLPTFESPTPNLGSPYFNNPTKRNFEPRVGFSWDPFRDGKTAVRGAFGIFDILPLDYEFYIGQATSAPYVVNLSAGSSKLTQGSFPTEAVGVASLPSSVAINSIQFNPPRNYVMIWNLNIQRQLTPTTTVTVGYVGNHGVHMLNRTDDVNAVLPMSTPQGLLWPTPAGSGTTINPNVGDIRGIYWGGDSEYDALEVQVTKRMSHGFQVEGSYTWGKNIDTGSASVLGDPYVNSISSLFWFCNKCRRAPSDINIPQILVANYSWNIPTPKNWGAISSSALGGWQLGGIITAESGLPITPLIGGDPLGLNSSDPYDFPNRVTGGSCQSPVNPGNPNNYIKLSCFTVPNPLTLMGNAGRNSIVGPGLVTWDFSLFKNNYIRKISETFNLQFRSEFFNILNRPNFAAPVDNETLFDQSGNPIGGAGAVDTTSTTSRQIQLALKVIW